MRRKDYKIPIISALIYWIPSSVYLIYQFVDSDTLFPNWLASFLTPGCILGFALGYTGNVVLAFLGQIITLIILIFIAKILFVPFSTKLRKTRKHNKI